MSTVVLPAEKSKGSLYSPRKSRKDVYLTYGDDDGQSKDIGPEMIMLKDEEDDADRIDSPFPAAFSPTGKTTSLSLDIDIALDEKKQTAETRDLYATVVPKSERPKSKEYEKKDHETNGELPVANSEVALSVDPQSLYAQVTPKSKRKQLGVKENGSVANGGPLSSGDAQRADKKDKKTLNVAEARSRVLSAIGSQPIALQSDYNDIVYHRNVSTAQHINSSLGSRISYSESAEL